MAMKYVDGGGNPFEQARNVFRIARRSILAFVGTGGIMASIQADVEWLRELIPWPKTEKQQQQRQQQQPQQQQQKQEAITEAPAIAG
eukprot:CAMPEP_0118703746 /NCGR_PEP_ID=MMETSP0800-20121206/18770_1 /TAXON_ID=210618 ORGANISM="Striatella unipunctata, Strain CCMP2910" /NCGR_SAMPLE_ID=MMETSP0800 /ASSEMBLY_ACC=CAM_ASM_000638 /LENGTH=86 /DNA_ID=CAMNT_0006605397 /DNA_START=142 /DNA_END=402 /DNA_ORIENTATION=-